MRPKIVAIVAARARSRSAALISVVVFILFRLIYVVDVVEGLFLRRCGYSRKQCTFEYVPRFLSIAAAGPATLGCQIIVWDVKEFRTVFAISVR